MNPLQQKLTQGASDLPATKDEMKARLAAHDPSNTITAPATQIRLNLRPSTHPQPMKSPPSRIPVTREPAPILKPLALSERLTQMLVQSLQRTLHHSCAVESILILSYIERAAALRNDVTQFHTAIKERLAKKS